MIHIGFTGTRHGMTGAQRTTLYLRLLNLYRDAGITFHHGDCIGADAAFHGIVRKLVGGWIVGHLPVDDSHRAFCDFDETRDPLPHMRRNAAIVAAADIMFATPYEAEEQDRGGTWATIRMARKAGKELDVILPDGSVRAYPARSRHERSVLQSIERLHCDTTGSGPIGNRVEREKLIDWLSWRVCDAWTPNRSEFIRSPSPKVDDAIRKLAQLVLADAARKETP